MPLRAYLNHCEKEILIKALQKYGTPAAAAGVLQIDISNIYRKMRKHGITAEKQYS